MREINVEIGTKQEFDNGCTVWYDEEDYEGFWVGCTPYGQDNMIKADIKELNDWLDFWSEDRDETGTLLNYEQTTREAYQEEQAVNTDYSSIGKW